MIKCTDALFAETSPTTFFRRRNKHKSQQEEHEISDPQIAQKLELILISLREQAAKASSYFQYQKGQLQSQVNEQSKIIELLEEENNILRSHVDLYAEKYGQIGPDMAKTLKIYSQLYVEKLKIQEHGTLKVKDQLRSTKRSSNMSTTYKSSYDKQSHSSAKSQIQQNHDAQSQINHQESDDTSNQNSNSASSNFLKKYIPCHEESLQDYKEHEIRILPLRTRHPSQQMSQISEIQSLKSALGEENSDQANDLGLQSKGSGFYAKSLKEQMNLNEDQTLLIEGSNFSCYESELRIHPAFQSSSSFIEEVQQQDHFIPQQTDSDIRRMEEVLSTKFGQAKSAQSQKHSQKNRNPDTQFSQSNAKQLRDLNNSYFKSLSIFQSRSKQNDIILYKNDPNDNEDFDRIKSTKCSLKAAEKKLKSLFEPLPQNIVCKKVELPKKNNETKFHYARQSQNLQKLSQLFKPFETKILLNEQKNNPYEKNKKAKRTNLNKRIL